LLSYVSDFIPDAAKRKTAWPVVQADGNSALQNSWLA
jgi:hypothetical protein